MRRGSLPSIALICAGLSSLTRNGPEAGMEEGRVIASAGSLNVRSGHLSRRAILATAAIPLFLIAMWVRTPAVPRTSGPPSPNGSERVNAAEGAVRALERTLTETRERLDERAKRALDAPTDPEDAFAFLSTRSPQRDGESLVLYDRDRPFAWSGEMRIDPDTLTAPLSVTFSPFYATLNVVETRGTRRAVASAVLYAAPPADRLTESVDERLAPAQGVSSYEFSPPVDARGGPVVLAANGKPILRALPRLATADEARFRRAATLRARGAAALIALVLAFLVYSWRERHSLADRMFAVAVALTITAVIPWNAFSNTSRLFDPAYYFSRLAGPLTANAGALCISATLILMAVYAVIRAHPEAQWPRLYAAIGALVTLGIGIPFASNIVRGIGQPPWGSTPGLWLSWEIPVFLFLFAVLLAAYWMLRMALGHRGIVHLSGGAHHRLCVRHRRAGRPLVHDIARAHAAGRTGCRRSRTRGRLCGPTHASIRDHAGAVSATAQPCRPVEGLCRLGPGVG